MWERETSHGKKHDQLGGSKNSNLFLFENKNSVAHMPLHLTFAAVALLCAWKHIHIPSSTPCFICLSKQHLSHRTDGANRYPWKCRCFPETSIQVIKGYSAAVSIFGDVMGICVVGHHGAKYQQRISLISALISVKAKPRCHF